MKKTYNAVIRMTEEERQKLERLAEATNTNKSEVIRTLLSIAIPSYMPALILQVKEEQHEQTA